ncbi:MAG: hypothetical protein AAFX85_15875 [Pseudomonadota bacterium]
MGDSAIGLAGLGFWLFIAAAVVSGVWDDARKRETRHATLRTLIESGQRVDQETLDRLLGKTQRMEHDLRIGSYIMRYIAAGLVVFALCMAFLSTDILFPLLGAASIVGLISVGMITAANYVERVEGESDPRGDDVLLPGRTDSVASGGATAPDGDESEA